MTEKENKKLIHRKSTKFISEYATGATISGPTNDGFYILTFHADCVDVLSETLTEKGVIDNNITTYDLAVLPEDTQDFREDKARIAMTMDRLTAVRNLLNQVIADNQQKTKDKA